MQAECDLAGQHRRIRWEILRAYSTDRALGAGDRDQRLLEMDDAGCQGPLELTFLGRDHAMDLCAPLVQVRVGHVHRVDDDTREVGEERLLAAEQPAVPDGASKESPHDVAAPLVRRANSVGHEEGQRADVVGDDLVAEPLRLERLGVVAEQAAHVLVDRHEIGPCRSWY